MGSGFVWPRLLCLAQAPVFFPGPLGALFYVAGSRLRCDQCGERLQQGRDSPKTLRFAVSRAV